MITTSYIALGSNLNNPVKQVQNALLHIANIPHTTITAQSRLYETKPLGPQNQPDYVNQVIAVETQLSPHALLNALLDIELQMGRIRLERWGARIIDCDIILFGDQIIQTPSLTIPHPEMKNRSFVLYPLAEIAPDLVLPSKEALQDIIDRDAHGARTRAQ
jgi:2-amino-4-hydroxy-6-hydroxymethyldihydropteridine diphosphokinase